MKATIISGIAVAVMTVSAAAVPASAFGLGISDSSTRKSSTKISIGKDGISFEDTYCRSSGMSIGMGMSGSSAKSAAVDGCDTAAQVVNNPPANSTVTINGLCDADAAKAKANITGQNVNVVVNSTGPCVENDVTPVTVEVVKVVTKEVATLAATTTPTAPSTPVELPQTGISLMAPAAAGVLGAIAYGGTLAIRTLRARA